MRRRNKPPAHNSLLKREQNKERQERINNQVRKRKEQNG